MGTVSLNEMGVRDPYAPELANLRRASGAEICVCRDSRGNLYLHARCGAEWLDVALLRSGALGTQNREAQ